jgi:hypothetical protein
VVKDRVKVVKDMTDRIQYSREKKIPTRETQGQGYIIPMGE